MRTLSGCSALMKLLLLLIVLGYLGGITIQFLWWDLIM